MSNQLNMWFVKLSFWQKTSYVLFVGWLGLSLYSSFYRGPANFPDVFMYGYLFCMFGTLVSFTMNMIWKNVSEKEKMRVRIRELEEEICKHKGGEE